MIPCDILASPELVPFVFIFAFLGVPIVFQSPGNCCFVFFAGVLVPAIKEG